LGIRWDDALASTADLADTAIQSGRAAPLALADLISAITTLRRTPKAGAGRNPHRRRCPNALLEDAGLLSRRAHHMQPTKISPTLLLVGRTTIMVTDASPLIVNSFDNALFCAIQYIQPTWNGAAR